VRRVNGLTGQISTIAGTRSSVTVAESGNHRVRRIDLDDWSIETVLGVGVGATSGEGTPARYFPLDEPLGVAVDSYGNLFVTSRTIVREVVSGADGIARGDDEVLTIYGGPPRDTFPEAVTSCLTGIGFAPASADGSKLLVLDACQGFLLRLDRSTPL